jgi:hypothetical protein
VPDPAPYSWPAFSESVATMMSIDSPALRPALRDQLMIVSSQCNYYAIVELPPKSCAS